MRMRSAGFAIGAVLVLAAPALASGSGSSALREGAGSVTPLRSSVSTAAGSWTATASMAVARADVTLTRLGEVEVDDGVLVIKRIHVRYSLALDPDADRAAAQRAFEHHMPYCPVYRSIRQAIDVTTSLELTTA